MFLSVISYFLIDFFRYINYTMYVNKIQVLKLNVLSTINNTGGNMKNNMTAEEYLEKILSGNPKDNCPMRKALEFISGKWRTHIIYELCKRPTCRFGELKKALPQITNTMLTSTLRTLEQYGIVNRTQYNEIPPRVEYSLTEKGKALLPTFLELAKWGENYLD